MSQRKDFTEYPEVIDFEGPRNTSMRQIHLIALALVGLGIVFAILAPPGGFILLIIFILIAVGYDIIFLRKSQKLVRISLWLRNDPVQATFNGEKIGPINTGTIVTDMDNPNELGFRPAPGRKLLMWEFKSEQDAKIVAKRLLEYLPLEE